MGITGEIADGTIGFGGFFAFVQTADIDITVQTQGFRLDVNLNWYGHVRRGVSPLRQLNQGTHSGIVS